jgi:hypothetical protein
VVMRSPCAGAALDPPLWTVVPNNARALSLSLSRARAPLKIPAVCVCVCVFITAVPVCVFTAGPSTKLFITAGPSTKLFAWGDVGGVTVSFIVFERENALQFSHVHGLHDAAPTLHVSSARSLSFMPLRSHSRADVPRTFIPAHPCLH